MILTPSQRRAIDALAKTAGDIQASIQVDTFIDEEMRLIRLERRKALAAQDRNLIKTQTDLVIQYVEALERSPYFNQDTSKMNQEESKEYSRLYKSLLEDKVYLDTCRREYESVDPYDCKTFSDPFGSLEKAPSNRHSAITF